MSDPFRQGHPYVSLMAGGVLLDLELGFALWFFYYGRLGGGGDRKVDLVGMYSMLGMQIEWRSLGGGWLAGMPFVTYHLPL